VLPGRSNSIFYGEKLLTTGNPDTEHDQNLSGGSNRRGTRAVSLRKLRGNGVNASHDYALDIAACARLR